MKLGELIAVSGITMVIGGGITVGVIYGLIKLVKYAWGA